MYTKKRYSALAMLLWTRNETLIFVVMSVVPVVIYDVFEQRWLHLPWLPIALVGTAVAFILGFQNNAVYGRLWEARKIWGGIVNASRAWGFQVNDFVTNQFADEPASEEELAGIRRCLVLRHIAWMTALRHALRASRPWEGGVSEGTNKEWAARIGVREHHITLRDDIVDYVPADDLECVLRRANPAAQLLGKQSAQLRALRERGLIEDFRHMEMQSTLTELVGHQGKSERIKNFPYPRQYATLNWGFLWAFLVLLPLGMLHEFDKVGQSIQAEHGQIGELFIWFSVPLTVLVMWVFHTLERIGRVGENPFEGSPNDVPITTMARGIEIDLRELLGEDPATIPSPIEAKFGTQT